MKLSGLRIDLAAGTVLAALLIFSSDFAFSQANFYEGKTITVIAFTAPGGSGDLRVKATVPFLKKHIPGNPTVVIEYMDGGGGRKGANHIYHSVRPDGLTMGAASGAIVGLGIMREQGVSYDVDKFIYLGTAEHENHAVIYTRRDLGLDNLEKLRAKPGIRIGGQTVGHVSYVAGRFFAYFLDLKEPKFIVGYTAPEVDVALVNGELDAQSQCGRIGFAPQSGMVRQRTDEFHAIMEIPKGDKHPRLGHLPEVESFAKTEREKRVLARLACFPRRRLPLHLASGNTQRQGRDSRRGDAQDL